MLRNKMMMGSLFPIMGSVLLCFLATDVHAKTKASTATTTIRVSADGDDKANGETQPVATLHRAQALILQAVEQLSKDPKGKGKRIVVSIAPGEYYLQEPPGLRFPIQHAKREKHYVDTQ